MVAQVEDYAVVRSYSLEDSVAVEQAMIVDRYLRVTFRMVFSVDVDDWFLASHRSPERKPADPGIKGQAPEVAGNW